MSDPITITVYAVGYSSYGQLFDARIGEQLLVGRSAQPLLDGCRVLLRQGIDPASPVIMRHDGSEAYLSSTVGAAAALRVRDDSGGKPVFEKWKPSPWDSPAGRDAEKASPVAPPMRQTEVPATSPQETAA